MSGFDVAKVRSLFPGLAREQDGVPIVFADSPGGSQVPEQVIEAMSSYLRTSNSNTHGAFTTSQETDALIDRARRAAADVTGSAPDEIVFGPNATSLLFSISRSFARTLRRGDEIVVTRLDHDANIRPWVMAARDKRALVRWVDIREDDVTIDVDSFEAAITDRTRLVAFTLASNAVGTIPDASRLVQIAKSAGALVAVDAVHMAQHRSLDLTDLGADVMVCSPYKFFGPHLGVLAAAREHLESWVPYKLRPAPDSSPERWETGTLSHESLAGLVVAVSYLAEAGRAFADVEGGSTDREAIVAAYGAFEEHERDLARRFLEGITAIDGIELYGIADVDRTHERTPTFCLRLPGQDPLTTAKELAARGIFVWDGHYYAMELMDRLGLSHGGAVRIGFCHYHTPDEVDRVLAALTEISRL